MGRQLTHMTPQRFQTSHTPMRRSRKEEVSSTFLRGRSALSFEELTGYGLRG